MYKKELQYRCNLVHQRMSYTPANNATNRKIVCLGAGYVGGPTMAVIAKHNPNIDVYVLDLNVSRISQWQTGVPFYEPGLDTVVDTCRNRNLFFSCNVEKHLRDADIIFLSVNTPTKMYGTGMGSASDVSYFEAAAYMIAKMVRKPEVIIVEKSTVPLQTAEAIDTIFRHNMHPSVKYSILSNPEFLAEGTAVADLENPDRVLIGGENAQAIETLVNIYAAWVPKERILTTNTWSSELSKLVANAMLAQRVSSINAISAICEKTGADIKEVSRCIGMDTRIGSKFLQPSVGFGGSCFHKDILNLVYIADTMGLPEVANYWRTVVTMNEWNKTRFAINVYKAMNRNLKNKKIVVLGFAFKANTSDTRETPAIHVCKYFMKEQANLHIYDPKVTKESIVEDLSLHNEEYSHHNSSVTIHDNLSGNIFAGAHAVCVLTDWREFADISTWNDIYESMIQPAHIFDGRYFLDHKHLTNIGFQVHCIGKKM